MTQSDGFEPRCCKDKSGIVAPEIGQRSFRTITYPLTSVNYPGGGERGTIISSNRYLQRDVSHFLACRKLPNINVDSQNVPVKGIFRWFPKIQF